MLRTFCLSAVLAVSTAPATAADTEARAQFLDEAPDGWRELRSALLSVKASVSDTVETFDGSTATVRRSEMEYNGANGNVRYVSRYTEGQYTGEEFIAGINPRYAFTAKREPSQTSYVVTYVGEDRGDVLRQLENRNVMMIGLVVQFTPIDTIVADRTFELQEVEREGELVRIRFTADFAPSGSYRIRGGRITFDPKRLWAIQEYTVRITYSDGDGFLTGKTEYVTGTEPLPAPQSFELVSRDAPNGKVLFRRTLLYQGAGPGDVKESDCTLTAFGLPEPGFAKQRDYSLLLWINGIAVLFVILAIVFRRMAKRA